ncbi:hypothetical protein DBR37_16085 [Herminiimonas sp. KBW02]|uniref:hypothetical protein n=1 Tax=Herminiimonas sp. KBW02 TaxID=2153363 RepID=UPI000F5A5EB2|nr:hypothetical protein [Herminiimonas sp. KBW02]RQO32820.1 hypothetical protein DBR37_16085 [Herminiimonas sp. KBW02]
MIDFLLSGIGRVVIGAIGGAVGAVLASGIGNKLKWSSNVRTVVVVVAAALLGIGLPGVVAHFAKQEKISVMVDAGLDIARGISAKADMAETMDGRDEILINEGRKAANEVLRKLDAKEKVRYAAGEFWAYYFVVTVGRAEYCAKQGVPIDGFVSGVQRLNKLDFDGAASIVSPKDAEAFFREHVLPKARTDIEAMHHSLSERYQVPVQVFCKAYQEQAIEAAQDFKFSDAMPQLSYILRTATENR